MDSWPWFVAALAVVVVIYMVVKDWRDRGSP